MSPPMVTAAEPDPSGPSIRLWNPNAAALWSLLFSPAFGAFLHAGNWSVLGDQRRAKQSMVWFYTSIAIIVAIVVLPMPEAIGDKAGRLIGMGLLLAWYFSMGKQQIELVKEMFPNGSYRKRSWLPPLAIGAASVAGLIGLVVGVELLGPGASPEMVATALAEDVKPSIEKEWKKIPDLAGASVNRVTLRPVGDSISKFSGQVDATIHGQSMHFPIVVTFDSKAGTMGWEIGEGSK